MNFISVMSISVIAVVSAIVVVFEKRGKTDFNSLLIAPILLKLNSRYFYGVIVAAIYLWIAFYFSTQMIIGSSSFPFIELVDELFLMSMIPIFIVGFGGGSTFAMVIIAIIEVLLIATITQFLIPKKWVTKIDKKLQNRAESDEKKM